MSKRGRPRKNKTLFTVRNWIEYTSDSDSDSNNIQQNVPYEITEGPLQLKRRLTKEMVRNEVAGASFEQEVEDGQVARPSFEQEVEDGQVAGSSLEQQVQDGQVAGPSLEQQVQDDTVAGPSFA